MSTSRCGVLQCVAVCCSVLQCVAVCLRALDRYLRMIFECLPRVAVCCSVLQCVAVCRCVLQCVAVRCSVLQCVAVCCSVLQCIAGCCSVLQCIVASCRCSEPLFVYLALRVFALACDGINFVNKNERGRARLSLGKNLADFLFGLARHARHYLWCAHLIHVCTSRVTRDPSHELKI